MALSVQPEAQVEGTRVARRLEGRERRCDGYHLAATEEDVVGRAERHCRLVHAGRSERAILPAAGPHPVQQAPDRGDRLARGDRAVPGAADEPLAEQERPAGLADHAAAALLVLRDDPDVT